MGKLASNAKLTRGNIARGSAPADRLHMIVCLENKNRAYHLVLHLKIFHQVKGAVVTISIEPPWRYFVLKYGRA